MSTESKPVSLLAAGTAAAAAFVAGAFTAHYFSSRKSCAAGGGDAKSVAAVDSKSKAKSGAGKLELVPMTREAVPICGPICERAFNSLADKLGQIAEMPPGLPALIFGGALNESENHYAVMAVLDGVIIGSNVVEAVEGGIASIGPISVEPGVQAGGVGKLLMQAVIDWALKRGVKDIRLMQMIDNRVSWSLYTKLGFTSVLTVADFRVTDPAKLALVPVSAGLVVRDLTSADLDACDSIVRDVTGQKTRRLAIESAAHSALARLVAVDAKTNAVVGFTTGFRIDQFTVTRSEDALKSLLTEYARRYQKHETAAAHKIKPFVASSILIHLPVRFYPKLACWLLDGGAGGGGCALVRQNTCMQLQAPAAGATPKWRDPNPSAGVYLPSVSGY